MSDAPTTLKLKLQILCGDAIAMGPGKADLLDAISAEGSISGAGRRLGMSYRRAWQLVDLMNRCWSAPLVETSPGSARGGGARLTELGTDGSEAARKASPQPGRPRGSGRRRLERFCISLWFGLRQGSSAWARQYRSAPPVQSKVAAAVPSSAK
jgi:molybdate transport repressor ModE-like protein